MNIQLLIDKQESQLTELLEVLNNELSVIVKRDHESLNQCVEKKEKLLSQVIEVDQLLAQSEIKEQIKNETALQQSRQKIDSLLLDCKKQNEVNLVAANQSQISANKLRSILFGKSKLTTYDKGGKAFNQQTPLSKGIKA